MISALRIISYIFIENYRIIECYKCVVTLFIHLSISYCSLNIRRHSFLLCVLLVHARSMIRKRESAGWYNTQAPTDEGADQSALMNSLVLLFVVCIDEDRFPSFCAFFISCLDIIAC